VWADGGLSRREISKLEGFKVSKKNENGQYCRMCLNFETLKL